MAATVMAGADGKGRHGAMVGEGAAGRSAVRARRAATAPPAMPAPMAIHFRDWRRGCDRGLGFGHILKRHDAGAGLFLEARMRSWKRPVWLPESVVARPWESVMTISVRSPLAKTPPGPLEGGS